MRRTSVPVLSSGSNNEWPRICTARCHHRPVDLLLQVLGVQFLMKLDASRLDHRSSQETGGGIRYLVSLAPFGAV